MVVSCDWDCGNDWLYMCFWTCDYDTVAQLHKAWLTSAPGYQESTNQECLKQKRFHANCLLTVG